MTEKEKKAKRKSINTSSLGLENSYVQNSFVENDAKRQRQVSNSIKKMFISYPKK